MMTLGQLSQHLLSHSTRPEAMALGHYLQNYCNPNDAVTSSAFDQFFRRAYSFSFWRDNKLQLSSTLEALLGDLARRQAPGLDVEGLMKFAQCQEIEIERISDLKDMLSRHLGEQVEEGDQFRLISLPNQRVMAIVLLQSGVIRVSLFSNWATLRGGNLIPLLDDMHVVYGPQLEIAHNQIHHIEVGANVFCRFKVSERGYTGYLIRGYTFQRHETLNGGPLTGHPGLFYPLKRLEQFFINRETDPLYREITSTLEKASTLVRQGEPDAIRIAHGALKRAQTAYENIFIEDRLLGLMIRDLTRMLPLSMGDKEAPEANW